MKKVLAWAKSNLITVAALGVALIGTPVMLYFSSKQAESVRQEVQEEVGSDIRSVQSVSVTYRAPSPRPGEPPIEFRRPPNEATTEALRSYIDSVQEQTSAVYEVVESRNEEGKTPMLEGLFPAPAPGRETQLRQEASDAWLDAHDELLERAGAGGPPDPESVLATLQGVYDQRMSVLQAQGFEATPEKMEEIRVELAQQRLGIYEQRAQDLTFYADEDLFANVRAWEEQSLPTIPQIFDWQWRLWVHENIVEALTLANEDPVSGARRYLTEGPVKRVMSIDVPTWDMESGTEPVARGGPGTPISLDYNASITGRAGYPTNTNPVFDIRYARVELIADSSRIPAIVDAFARADFMSVLDMDISEVDAGADRNEGYAYGPDHVVKATLLIETLWLRSWTTALMPEAVRNAIGAAPPPDAEAEEAAQAEQPQEPAERTGRRRERDR